MIYQTCAQCSQSVSLKMFVSPYVRCIASKCGSCGLYNDHTVCVCVFCQFRFFDLVFGHLMWCCNVFSEKFTKREDSFSFRFVSPNPTFSCTVCLWTFSSYLLIHSISLWIETNHISHFLLLDAIGRFENIAWDFFVCSFQTISYYIQL